MMNGGERMDSGETLFIEEREIVRKWMRATSATQEENGLLPPLSGKCVAKAATPWIGRLMKRERDGGRGRERMWEYGDIGFLHTSSMRVCAL